jgi:hypothetical protein
VTGFNDQSAERDYPFTQGTEPATLPRLQEVHIISPESPWCTTVRNDNGVTLQDIFTQLWKECVNVAPLLARHISPACSYTDHLITDAEINACPARVQEVIKRYSMNSSQSAYAIYSPSPGRLRRIGQSARAAHLQSVCLTNRHRLAS